jgi:hypothetical protein
MMPRSGTSLIDGTDAGISGAHAGNRIAERGIQAIEDAMRA